MNQDKRTELSVQAEKAILVSVILPDSTADPRDPLGELASLAKTAGAEVVARVVQQRHRIDPSTFIGARKAEELNLLATLHNANDVIFAHDMSPNQLRDLEKIIRPQNPLTTANSSSTSSPPNAPAPRRPSSRSPSPSSNTPTPLLRHMWSQLGTPSARTPGVPASALRSPGEMQLEIDRPHRAAQKVADLKARIREKSRTADPAKARAPTPALHHLPRRLHQAPARARCSTP